MCDTMSLSDVVWFLQMAKMDLNGDEEKDNIEKIFWCAMDMLSDDDKKLPQASYLINFGVFPPSQHITMPHANL